MPPTTFMIKITIPFDKFQQLQWPRENVFSEDHSLLNTFLTLPSENRLWFFPFYKQGTF